MIILSRKSPKTGKVSEMVLDTTKERLDSYYAGDNKFGRLVQDIFPNLSIVEREFIMTGYTAQDWEDLEKAWE